MATIDNEKQLKIVMATVFETTVDEITENASPDTIEKWDSLHHMTLVLALEETFGIELTEDQTIEILNYKLIKLVLHEHGVKFD